MWSAFLKCLFDTLKNLKPAKESEIIHFLLLREFWNNPHILVPHEEVWGSKSQVGMLRGMHNIIPVITIPSVVQSWCVFVFDGCFSWGSLWRVWLCSLALIAALKHHPWPLTSPNNLLFSLRKSFVHAKWFVFLNQSATGGNEDIFESTWPVAFVNTDLPADGRSCLGSRKPGSRTALKVCHRSSALL